MLSSVVNLLSTHFQTSCGTLTEIFTPLTIMDTVPAFFEAFAGYNKPENRKKKIDHAKLKAAELLAHSSALFCLAGSSYMKRQPWTSTREAVLRLADNLRKHAAYLSHQN